MSPHAETDRISAALTHALKKHSDDDKPPHLQPGSAALDGIVPKAVVCVHTTEQVASVVAAAGKQRWHITPVGGATHMHWGAPLERIDVAVDMAGMNEIVAYDRDDMTITVQAGVTYEQLQHVLQDGRQYVPVDPPVEPTATIGGIVAANVAGPLRFSQGTWRDFVIGTQTVLADGRTVRSGGRVVKNAAGFDVSKLYIGSLGTLGIVTELTLMVRPLPEARQAIVVPLSRADIIEPVLAALLRADLEPAFVELFNGDALRRDAAARVWADTPYALLAGFSGSMKAVAWQMEHALETIAGLPTPTGHELQPEAVEWDRAYAAVHNIRRTVPTDTVLRTRVLCSEIGPFMAQAETLLAKHDRSWAMSATAGAGIVHLYPNDAADAAVVPLIKSLQQLALTPEPAPSVPPLQPTGGAGRTVLPSAATSDPFSGLGDLALLRQLHSRSLVIEAGPPALRTALPLPESSLANKPLMKKIKQNFDPNYVLNKGRFVGG